MNFKITYNEPGVINLTSEIEAENGREAVTVFQIENPNADVVSVEEVSDA